MKKKIGIPYDIWMEKEFGLVQSYSDYDRGAYNRYMQGDDACTTYDESLTQSLLERANEQLEQKYYVL